MKRNILSLLIALFATMQVAAQTYDNLWKQAEINAQKDQPKSEIAVMKKIIAKASVAKDYGQLLAAEMRQMTLWKEISADSYEKKHFITSDSPLCYNAGSGSDIRQLVEAS